MADKNLRIKVTTQGAKKASRDLGNVDKGLKGLGKSALKAGAAFFAGRSIISGLRASIELSAKFEGIEKGFNNLAKSTGFTADAFKKFQDATDGTIGSVELMTQANNAMLLGITDSEDQMAEMFDIAQRLAQALGQDTRFGIESLVTGMGRQSKLMLDNLGIMIDVEKANEDYASALGVSASALTDQQKKQAFVNATMESARGLVGDLGDEQLTTNDAMNQAQASFGDLAIAIGTKLSPLVIAVAKDLGTTADNLTRLLETGSMEEEPAVRTVETVKKEIASLKKVMKEDTKGEDILSFFVEGPKLVESWAGLRTEAELLSETIDKTAQGPLYDPMVASLQALEAELERLTAIEKESAPEADAFDDWLNAQQQVIEQSDAASKAAGEAAKAKNAAMEKEIEFVDVLTEMYPELANQLQAVKVEQESVVALAAFDDFIKKQQKIVDLKAQESEWMDVIKEMYPALASSMGLFVEEEEKWLERTQESLGSIGSFVDAASGLYDNLFAHKKQLLDNDMNAEIQAVQKSSSSEESKQAEISNIKEKYRQQEIDAQKKLKPIKYAQAVSDTASAVVGALGNKPWTPVKFALAGLVAASGAAQIATISAQPFAKGADFITSGPQVMMVGEAGPESVQVTPLTPGMNQNGPKGDININISAPLVSETVVEEILPAIERAKRLDLA